MKRNAIRGRSLFLFSRAPFEGGRVMISQHLFRSRVTKTPGGFKAGCHEITLGGRVMKSPVGGGSLNHFWGECCIELAYLMIYT